MSELSPSEENLRWILQLAMGIWDMVEGVLIFLILSWGIPQVKEIRSSQFEQQPFHQPYLTNFLAEYLRLLAQVILYGLLLFIPGVIRYCRLIFVPYIALFSKAYRADQVDALELSTQLTAKKFRTIFLVFIGTTILQVVFEFLPHMVAGLHFWPVRLLLMGLNLIVTIWTFSFMFELFEKAVTEEG